MARWDSHSMIRSVAAAFAVCSVLAAIVLLVILVFTVRTTHIPFDTDESNHAIDGWEVYHALRQGVPGDLRRAVVGQGFYPPVHSFFVAAGYLLAGPSLASSRMPTVVIFALALVTLGGLTFTLAVRRAGGAPSARPLALIAAAFALGLAISSPSFVVTSILVMLEMTGAWLGLLLLFAADRTDCGRSLRGRRLWLATAAVTATATFLTKYSFGLFYLPGLVAALVTAVPPQRAGRRAFGEAAAVMAICTAVLGLWALVTDRTTLWLFFFDQPRYAPLLSAENLLYLPRVWLDDYAGTPLVAGTAIGLAGIGVVRGWQALAVRTAAWSIAAALLVLTVSTTDQPRHFLPLAPAVWMLAGLGLGESLRWLDRRFGERAVAAALIAVVLLLAAGAVRSALTLPGRLQETLEGVPAYGDLQEFVLDQVDLDQPVLLMGDFGDRNSLLAVRWLAGIRTGQSTWELNIDFFPFEQYEHSLLRTHRKPQIASVDPAFAHRYVDDVLAQGYYPSIVEVKQAGDYYGPRAGNPDDPLCAYAVVERRFDGWIALIYDISAGPQNPCGEP